MTDRDEEIDRLKQGLRAIRETVIDQVNTLLVDMERNPTRGHLQVFGASLKTHAALIADDLCPCAPTGGHDAGCEVTLGTGLGCSCTGGRDEIN